MSLDQFLKQLGDPVSDAEEESFLLFTTSIPSSNLGFIDSKALGLDISINGQDISIQQSPGLLNSNLAGGTTGAVLWKVTPSFARWISDAKNCLFKNFVLTSNSVVLELGAGISGLIAIALAPQVKKYVVTDQSYVLKTLRQNIESNTSTSKCKKSKQSASQVEVIALDWEDTNVENLPSLLPELGSNDNGPDGLDAVIACDCIYNEALIPSFVKTCADLCRLRGKERPGVAENETGSPTMCIVAQQLRSDIVFEEWLHAFMVVFKVWRLPDELLNDELKEGHGFVVHIGILH